MSSQVVCAFRVGASERSKSKCCVIFYVKKNARYSKMHKKYWCCCCCMAWVREMHFTFSSSRSLLFSILSLSLIQFTLVQFRELSSLLLQYTTHKQVKFEFSQSTKWAGRPWAKKKKKKIYSVNPITSVGSLVGGGGMVWRKVNT